MKRKHSLKNRADIRNVFQKGNFKRFSVLSFKYLKSEFGYGRFVISVSKKHSKKAVVRNALKRKIRRALLEDGILPETGADFAIFCSSAYSEEAFRYDRILPAIQKFSRELQNEVSDEANR